MPRAGRYRTAESFGTLGGAGENEIAKRWVRTLVPERPGEQASRSWRSSPSTVAPSAMASRRITASTVASGVSGSASARWSAVEREIRELKRKVSEMERTIGILTAAASFFAREHDPLHR